MKYGNFTLGQVEAIINKLGGEDGAKKFLRGEVIAIEPARIWREQEGVIYFSVTSDGTTGKGWIERLEKKGFRVGNYAKQILRSPEFKSTSGVTTEVAVLKIALFEGNDWIINKIRAFAAERKLEAPNAEVACLIRENFPDEELKVMDLVWIVTMHEPIKNSRRDPDLLLADRRGDARRLSTYCARPVHRWYRDHGFAFAVSQTQG